ncbi:MAG: hypothetical protein JO094_10710 [Hyphomicrobiales bacterium]|nr:hypothetical protein [Hyphomicrobiales bacterium]
MAEPTRGRDPPLRHKPARFVMGALRWAYQGVGADASGAAPATGICDLALSVYRG